MASVTQKLAQFRESQKKHNEQIDLVKINAMSLEDLCKEKIAFGKAKLNQSFNEAFEDYG